jgi:CheY-like chemotaxis protein
MPLTKLKKRLQIDNDAEDRKLIKSVLDLINPPSNQPTEKEAGSGEQFNKDNLSNEHPKIVLHIDDDPEDREMVHEAIKSIDPSFIIVEAETGKAGIEFLKKAKSSGNLPCLIILDINMPGMNGFETYNEMKKDDALKTLPTVVFTTADFFKGGTRQGNENLPVFIKPDRIKDLVASLQKILTHCKDQ